MRLQIARHLEEYNRKHSHAQRFVVHYDDFNPFLDRFVNRLPARRRRIDRALTTWRLWDHMDAILSLAVTDLVSRTLNGHRSPTAPKLTPEQLDRLDRHQRRDLLLLAACYDQSTEQPAVERWKALGRRLKYWTIKAQIPFWIGVLVTVLVIYAAAVLLLTEGNESIARLAENLVPGRMKCVVDTVVLEDRIRLSVLLGKRIAYNPVMFQKALYFHQSQFDPRFSSSVGRSQCCHWRRRLPPRSTV